MLAKRLRIVIVSVLIIALIAALLFVLFPKHADADGGLIVPHDLWASMEEGHQIGVVTILDENKVSTDLFISIMDRTSVSHEVTFFVPIGKNAAGFKAYEEDLLTFDKNNTSDLDQILRDNASERMHALQALFSGALLTNGAIFTPAWAPLMLTGCGAMAQQPESTIQTESSDISVYSIDDNTNIEELIQTTGLAPNVANTLSGLKGQKVAIVKLQTKNSKVQVTDESRRYGGAAYAEPGLHMNWVNDLIQTDSGKTASYPLGTGDAWAKPIEMTRVYVQSPTGIKFRVQYPKYGDEHSGFDAITGARIHNYTTMAAYAVDEANGSYGHVWRGIYSKSNPTENIIIDVKKASVFSRFLTAMEDGGFGYSIIFAIFIGIIIWLFAFRLLMPVFIGKDARYVIPHWAEGFIYPAINLPFMIFPGVIMWAIYVLDAPAVALAIQFVIGAGVSIGIFMLVHSKKYGVTRGKALAAFILTSLCGSAAYLILATGFAFLVNAV